MGVLGRIVSTFAGGSPDGARHVWQGFSPWIQQLTMAAGTRWLPNLVHGVPCEVVGSGPCVSAAIEACEVCHKPCCLDHSFAAKSGAVVCYVCVQKAAAAAAPKVPGQKSASDRKQRAAPPPGPQPPPGPNGAPPPRPPPPKPPEEAYVAARRVLGVKRHADWPTIEAAYKKLLKRWHPDQHLPHAKADAEKRFKEIRTAYDFLKDHPE